MLSLNAFFFKNNVVISLNKHLQQKHHRIKVFYGIYFYIEEIIFIEFH